MPSFLPSDAAFEGFRFTRERPGAVAAWAGATLAFNLLSGLLGALIGGQALVEFQALAQAQPIDLGAVTALLPRLLPAFLITQAINLAGSAVVYPSAIRCFMGIDRQATFRVGEDEWRIMLLLIVYALIAFAVSAVTGLAFGLVENIVAAFNAEVANFIQFVSRIAAVAAPMAVLVRLLLAPVIAVDRKRISLKESWVSTRGHFMPLARSLAISTSLYIIVAFVGLLMVMFLAQALSLGTGGLVGGPASLAGADKSSIANFITPAVIFSELVTAAAVALALPVACGPLVRAYLAYDEPDAPAERRAQASPGGGLAG
jgi:hypothetical protein